MRSFHLEQKDKLEIGKLFHARSLACFLCVYTKFSNQNEIGIGIGIGIGTSHLIMVETNRAEALKKA